MIGGKSLRLRGGLADASYHTVMCSRAGYLPVMIDARVGEQTGAAA